jgi:hypothetical protein
MNDARLEHLSAAHNLYFEGRTKKRNLRLLCTLFFSSFNVSVPTPQLITHEILITLLSRQDDIK